ncbi:hypothetical protein BC629DRAFT_994960 [Irpex lacteus]|nr:hypothetical protein BC629DRAFT_994960 [Irpex lacteus]
MVFSNLSPSEKVAFFGLLDEYFASRPDVFGHVTGSDGGSADNGNNAIHAAAKTAAMSAIQHSFTGQSTATTSPSDANSGVPAWKRELLNARNNASASNPEPETPSTGFGRVASAAASFRSSPAASPPPPTTTNKLVAQKKFGDVDTTSAKGMYSSIRHGTANKSAVPPPVAAPIPPAFAAPKNNFAPPPVRRVSSTTSTAEPVRATPPPPPPPPPRAVEPEPEEPGEWAEALYEYASEDPGDLQLQEGQRVYVVEKTSDDWWTAIYEGKRGLVPASYVKLL